MLLSKRHEESPASPFSGLGFEVDGIQEVRCEATEAPPAAAKQAEQQHVAPHKGPGAEEASEGRGSRRASRRAEGRILWLPSQASAELVHHLLGEEEGSRSRLSGLQLPRRAAGPQGGQRAEGAEGQWRRPVLLQRLLEAAPKLLLLHALVGLLNGSRQALQEASAEQAGKSPLCFLLSLCL